MTGLATGDQVRFYLRLHSMTETVNGYMKVIYTGQNIATSASAVASAQIFKIPTLNNKGGVYFDYFVDVLDKNGKNIGSKSAQGEAFTLSTYTPPTITSLSAERYSIRPSDTGSSNILSADNTGEYVRFSFTLTPAVTTVTSNTYTLNVKATSGSGKTQNKNSAYTGATALTKTDDTTIFPSASFSFDPKEDWTFTFTVTDKVTSASYSTQVARAESILNVEPGGVAVGGFLSTGAAFTNNNLLRGTGNPKQIYANYQTGTWAAGTWYQSGGSSAAFKIIPVADCPDGVTAGFSISGSSGGVNKDLGQWGIPFTANQVYTISCWARVPSGSSQLEVYVFDRTTSNTLWIIKGQAVTGTTWQHFSKSFTFSGNVSNSSAHIGLQSGAAMDLCGFKLEKGSINNPVWTPASQDNAEVTPFSQPKRFETSDDCGAILRGGLWDGRGYRMDYVNNTTLMEYPEGFEPYATMGTDYSGNRIPMISRVGPIVFMEGTLRATKAGQLDFDGIKICTLPSWARPRMTISQVCQGTGVNIFWLRVEPNGDVIFSRYRTADSYTNYNVNTQFMFTLSWLAADAAPPLPSIT